MATRYFEYQDASSDKFWEIELLQSSFITRWGKRGTVGQSKEKAFDTTELAKKAYDKVVQEKLREGYVEKTNGATTSTATSTTTTTSATPTAPKPATPKPIKSSPNTHTSSSDNGSTQAKQPAVFKRPAQRPFDLEECLKRYEKADIGYYWKPDWRSLKLDFGMSRPEAQLWYHLSHATPCYGTRKPIIDHARKLNLDGKLSVADLNLLHKEHKNNFGFPPQVAVMLMILLDFEKFLDLVLDPANLNTEHHDAIALGQGFANHCVPAMDEAEREICRPRLRALLKDFTWPESNEFQLNFCLAAGLLGMEDLLCPILEAIPDNYYGSSRWAIRQHAPLPIIYTLSDSAKVDALVRRLGIVLSDGDEVKGWLAHTGLNGLDLVVTSAQGLKSKDEADSLVRALGQLDAPQVAVPMLQILTTTHSPRLAKEWLEAKPDRTIAGCLHVASTDSELGQAARKLLGNFANQGMEDRIVAAMADMAESEKARIVAEVLEDPIRKMAVMPDEAVPAELKSALQAVPKTKAPTWLNPAELPPLIIQKQRLSLNQVAAVLGALQAQVFPNANPTAEALRHLVERATLEDFAWTLFELWVNIGAPSKDKWAFQALGALGGDHIALKLTPLIKAWPGEAQHQRAVAGLEILRAIGTDTALMQLNGIAQKVSFKALKLRANECMEKIAKAKGLTKEELEDRVVPDCGLDERGRRSFDFGPRRFEFILGPDMKPMIRDSEGKNRPDLPSPNSKDDPEMSAACVDEWKLIKKQIRDTAKIQATRLENAMVIGRRWPVADFSLLIARHPLMTHLARLLLWGTYAKDGKLSATFRVTDEQDFADAQDDNLTLDGAATVGVVHPIHLQPAEIQAWGQIFADYDLIPPFAQLSRTVHSLEAAEKGADAILRLKGMIFPAPTLVFTMEKLGWARGIPQDAGCFDEHSKQFTAANVTAVLSYEGTVAMGYIEESEKLTVETVYFMPGMRRPSGFMSKEKGIKLGSIDPVVLSEVLHDLNVLASKVKEA